jgi:hypothetical protein
MQKSGSSGTAAMQGKSSKLASTALSALLYAQGLLGVAGGVAVILKYSMATTPPANITLVSAASVVQLR